MRSGERIIDLPCREKHEHTDACHLYGFHDFRRAFATRTPCGWSDALQSLMRHKSYLTTKGTLTWPGSWTVRSSNSTCRSFSRPVDGFKPTGRQPHGCRFCYAADSRKKPLPKSNVECLWSVDPPEPVQIVSASG